MSPKEISVLVSAYKKTLRALWLVDRDDPVARLIAQKIIEIGKTGSGDPSEISALAVKAFSFHSGPRPMGSTKIGNLLMAMRPNGRISLVDLRKSSVGGRGSTVDLELER
jgi:hypothetical protein